MTHIFDRSSSAHCVWPDRDLHSNGTGHFWVTLCFQFISFYPVAAAADSPKIWPTVTDLNHSQWMFFLVFQFLSSRKSFVSITHLFSGSTVNLLSSQIPFAVCSRLTRWPIYNYHLMLFILFVDYLRHGPDRHDDLPLDHLVLHISFPARYLIIPRRHSISPFDALIKCR